MAMRPKLWTISGLATELGVDRRTVAARLAEVPPDSTVQGYPAWRMRTAVAAIASAGGGGSDLSGARAKLAATQEELTRLRIDRERGDLLPAEEVVAAWQAAIGRARSLLLGIPPASSATLVLLARRSTDPNAAQRAIHDHLTGLIDGALAELANSTPDYLEDEDTS
jgi:phage terminase Nu1 subunit (DNA packaging protein)